MDNQSTITNIGDYILLQRPNVEFVNPIQYDFDSQLDFSFSMVAAFSESGKELENIDRLAIHQVAVEQHLEIWTERYNALMNIKFSDNFFSFLNCKNKKKQESILSKETYDSFKLTAIIYKAWEEYNFTFSFYRFEKKPAVYNNKKFPDLYHLQSDNSLNIIGSTDLSDGQLRGALKERNVIVASFLDNGKIWHCFFHTYNSINGVEVGGQPHMHYISSAFGNHVTRERVLSELQKFRYKLPPMKHLAYDRSEQKDFPVPPIIK